MLTQQRLLQHLRKSAIPAPVIGCCTAAMRNYEAQRREVLEQIALDELHDGGRVGVDVMRPGRVEAGVAARGYMDHGRNVEFHHFLIDRVPVPVGQRRAFPVTAGWIGIQIDANEPVLLHAFLELGDTGLRIDARALRQHGRADEIVREELRNPIAELVADGGPFRGDREVADVMGHEACARAEDGQIAAPLPHQPELVVLYGVAQLVVADLQLGGPRPHRRVVDASDLAVTPVLQRLRCRCVMAVTVDDHWNSPCRVNSDLWVEATLSGSGPQEARSLLLRKVVKAMPPLVCGSFLAYLTGAPKLCQQDGDRCADRRDSQHRQDGAEAPPQSQQSAADR
jgi:hypothetical protein